MKYTNMSPQMLMQQGLEEQVNPTDLASIT